LGFRGLIRGFWAKNWILGGLIRGFWAKNWILGVEKMLYGLKIWF